MKKIIITAKDEEGNPLELTLSLQRGRSKPAIKTAKSKEVKERVVIDGSHCPNCGKRTWDNRKKIETGMFSAKSPHFSCIDKEGCGWAVWTDQYELSGQKNDDLVETAKEIFDE